MKTESEPVTGDEILLRLIWETYVRPEDELSIRPNGFGPKPNERDGISVFRMACLNSADEVMAVIAPVKRARYAIVAIPASAVFALGMTVVPDPIPDVPGHAVIPELNCGSADTISTADRLLALAELASTVVIRPLSM